jgi:hypothetical protein
VRSRRGFQLETLEGRVALSGAAHLQGVTAELFVPSGPIFVQVSGVLTPSGHLNVKLDTAVPSGPVLPSSSIRVLLFSGRDTPPVELTGFISNNNLHAEFSGDVITPPPIT